MEDLTKVIVELQSFGLKLPTIVKIVKDIYKEEEKTKIAMVRRD